MPLTSADKLYTDRFLSDGSFIHTIYRMIANLPRGDKIGWATNLSTYLVIGLFKPFLAFHKTCYVHPERAIAWLLVIAVVAFFAWPAIAGLLGAIVAATAALGASAILSSVVGYLAVVLIALVSVSAVGNVQCAIQKHTNAANSTAVNETQGAKTTKADQEIDNKSFYGP